MANLSTFSTIEEKVKKYKDDYSLDKLSACGSLRYPRIPLRPLLFQRLREPEDSAYSARDEEDQRPIRQATAQRPA